MSVIEIALLGSFVLLPAYEFYKGGKTRQQVLSGKVTRVKLYQETMVLLLAWLSLFLLHFWTSTLTLEDMGLAPLLGAKPALTFGLLIAALAYCVFAVWYTTRSHENRQKVSSQIQEVAWVLPCEKREMTWFVGGVSVAAGVCEEVLFRGYLLHVVGHLAGMPFAVVFSSAVFGLCHFYLGWSHVLRTGLVGLVLALLYLWSGSLLLVIVLHFVLDAYSCMLSYVCLHDDNDKDGLDGIKHPSA